MGASAYFIDADIYLGRCDARYLPGKPPPKISDGGRGSARSFLDSQRRLARPAVTTLIESPRDTAASALERTGGPIRELGGWNVCVGRALLSQPDLPGQQRSPPNVVRLCEYEVRQAKAGVSRNSGYIRRLNTRRNPPAGAQSARPARQSQSNIVNTYTARAN